MYVSGAPSSSPQYSERLWELGGDRGDGSSPPFWGLFCSVPE